MEKKHSIERIDFSRREIHIIAESEIEKKFRVHACAKEPCTVRWIEEFAHKGVFYDIGANVGVYSLVAASLMDGSENRVIAFEPAYFNFNRFCENIVLNHLSERIIPLNIALTDKTELSDMHFSSNEFGYGEISLDEHGGGNFIKVLEVPLDNVIRYFGLPVPNHIKIDVEGGELDVLRGGMETFRNPLVKSVMIEVDKSIPLRDQEVCNFFNDAGFRLHEKTDSYIIKHQKVYDLHRVIWDLPERKINEREGFLLKNSVYYLLFLRD